jgi:SNF2 family DNA or RNA helicase
VDEEDVGLIEMDSDGDDLFFLDKPSSDISGKRKTSEKRSGRARVKDEGDDDEFDCVDWDGGSDEEGDGGGIDEGARRSAQLWRDILDGKGRGASESSRRRGKKSPEAAQASVATSSGNGKALKATEKAGATAFLFKRKSKLHQKILIFAHHREVMNRLEDCLREEQVDYIRLDGSVGTASRNTSVLDFQQNDEVSIEWNACPVSFVHVISTFILIYSCHLAFALICLCM